MSGKKCGQSAMPTKINNLSPNKMSTYSDATQARQMSNLASPTGQAVHEAELPREIQLLDSSLNIMEKRFSSLVARLSPVMAPERPTDPKAEKGSEAAMTAFGSSLRQFSIRVQSFNELLDCLCARLET